MIAVGLFLNGTFLKHEIKSMYKYTEVVYIYANGAPLYVERFLKEGRLNRAFVICSTYSEAWTGLLQMH